MSDSAAGLLGGLLIGGLVVGAAMSAENAAERQNRRNYARYGHGHRGSYPVHHHHPPPHPCTYCICGEQMKQGRIQQGVCKCSNLNCQRCLTGSLCYYCPKGSNCQQHRNGFFYCEACAIKAGGRNVKVVQLPPPQAQPKPTVIQQQAQSGYPAQKPAANKAYVVKQGYMSKKGGWLNTGYKKRWFKLWSNKKMAYLTHPGASYTKGYADLSHVTKMEKKGKHGFEVTTTERLWSFLCQSEEDREAWFSTIQSVCTDIKPEMQPKPSAVPSEVPYAQPYVPNAAPMYPPNQAQPYGVNLGQNVMHAQNPQSMYPDLSKQNANNQNNNNNNNSVPEMEPGASFGYNVGNMYGANNSNLNNNYDASAPPAAFSDVAPSAPLEDDVNYNEGEGQITQQ